MDIYPKLITYNTNTCHKSRNVKKKNTKNYPVYELGRDGIGFLYIFLFNVRNIWLSETTILSQNGYIFNQITPFIKLLHLCET